MPQSQIKGKFFLQFVKNGQLRTETHIGGQRMIAPRYTIRTKNAHLHTQLRTGRTQESAHTHIDGLHREFAHTPTSPFCYIYGYKQRYTHWLH